MKTAPEANKALDEYYKHRWPNIPTFLIVLWALLVLIAILILFIKLISEPIGLSTEERNHSDEEIANAIYLAEGGKKAKMPYGILSVKCSSETECRQICLNTIKNNRKRYADYGYKEYNTYLEFLASRYAPLNASNDPGNLNQHWLKNVKYFLRKEGERND